jgi:hypothetical protein
MFRDVIAGDEHQRAVKVKQGDHWLDFLLVLKVIHLFRRFQ